MRLQQQIAFAAAIATITSCTSASPLTSHQQKPRDGTATLQRLAVAPSFSSLSAGSELPPPPEKSPNASSTDVGDKVPERVVHPSYDIRQSARDMDQILADNQPHNITVLFADDYKVRVKTGKGSVRAADGSGVVALNNTNDAIGAINGVLSQYEFTSITAAFLADTKTEAELDERERGDEAKAGYEFPNDGSWATLKLSNYTPAKARALTQALQALPVVRMAEVVTNPRPGAVSYQMPPNDPMFPNQASWQSQDYTNPKTDSNGVAVESWWWNRHSIGGAWGFNKGSGVTVAVVDSAFQTSSDGVNWNTTYQKHFYKDSPTQTNVQNNTYVLPEARDTGTSSWHGTMVAHALGAADGNGASLCGIAPGVSLIPIKVDSDWDCIAAGTDHADASGAQVINLSWANGSANLEANGIIRAAMNRAWNNGRTVVYCAGNSSTQISYDPTIYTGAICVGGIGKNNGFYSATNWGTRVDLAAAAENITLGSSNASSPWAYKTEKQSGTSFA